MAHIFTSLIDMLSAHPSLAIGISFLVAFGEALLIVGLFVPSTTVLVGVGTLIGVGELAFWPVFIATVIGAIGGDALSFWVGWRYNERLRTVWPFNRYTQVLAQGEAFFRKYGGMSIFIVRFIPGAKAVVPAIAAMAGMPAGRFMVINVASAVAWSAVHILPAIALGRGIRVAHVADPRLMVLIAVVAVVLVLAWYATRLIYFILLPRMDRWRRAAVARLEARPGRWAGGAVRLLENRDGLFVSFVLGLLALIAARGFVYVLAQLLYVPDFSRSDQAISTFAQTLRDETVTRWMVAITMLGDGQVLIPAAALMVALFLARRQWGVAAVVLAAAAAATGFEPLLGTVVHRAGPTGLPEIAAAGIVPQGHSALATVVYGLMALFLGRLLRRRYRVAVYLVAVLLVALIGVSRIYLLAHWPSDVLAGLSFGTALVLITAFLLHGRRLTLPRRSFAAMTALVLVVLAPAHVALGYAGAQRGYALSLPLDRMSEAQWLAGGWRQVTQARVLLDGDYGEPMLLQSDRRLAELVRPFLAAGWTSVDPAQVNALLGAILPTSGGLDGHSPWPLTHVGRSPLVSLVRAMPDRPGARFTLRIWESGFVIDAGADPRSLLLASVTGERLDPVMLGWSLLEPLDLDGNEIAGLRAGVARLMGVPDAGTGPLRIH